MDGLTGSVNPDDFDRSRQREMDRSLLVRFEYRAKPDEAATSEAGHPVFKDVLYVDIRTPGERDPVVRPASARDIERFRDHYDAFMNRTAGPSDAGLPLAEWPMVTRSQVEALAYANCKTVEQLAGMSDSAAQKFPGSHQLRVKARAWLEAAKGDNLKAQLAERDGRIAYLEEQLLAMNQRINGFEPAPPAKKKIKASKVKVKVNGSNHDSDSASDR